MDISTPKVKAAAQPKPKQSEARPPVAKKAPQPSETPFMFDDFASI